MKAERSILINAPADKVYRQIADYREGHSRILPSRYLHSLEVETGGFGAGTIIRCKLRIFGKDRSFRAAATEPEPGRILTETDLAVQIRTTFTVDPQPNTQATKVTISTELGRPDGMFKKVEIFVAGMFLRRVYSEQLRLLKAVSEMSGVFGSGL
jgi:hypothetical protein